MSDYTPTTERVRNSYANDVASYPKPANVFEAAARAEAAKEEFDRWLAEHDRQVSERVWDQATANDYAGAYADDDNPYRSVTR